MANSAETNRVEVTSGTGVESKENILDLEKRIQTLLQEDFSKKDPSFWAKKILEIEREADKLGYNEQFTDDLEALFDKLLEQKPDDIASIQLELEKITSQQIEETVKVVNNIRERFEKAGYEQEENFFDRDMNDILANVGLTQNDVPNLVKEVTNIIEGKGLQVKKNYLVLVVASLPTEDIRKLDSDPALLNKIYTDITSDNSRLSDYIGYRLYDSKGHVEFVANIVKNNKLTLDRIDSILSDDESGLESTVNAIVKERLLSYFSGLEASPSLLKAISDMEIDTFGYTEDAKTKKTGVLNRFTAAMDLSDQDALTGIGYMMNNFYMFTDIDEKQPDMINRVGKFLLKKNLENTILYQDLQERGIDITIYQKTRIYNVFDTLGDRGIDSDITEIDHKLELLRDVLTFVGDENAEKVFGGRTGFYQINKPIVEDIFERPEEYEKILYYKSLDYGFSSRNGKLSLGDMDGLELLESIRDGKLQDNPDMLANIMKSTIIDFVISSGGTGQIVEKLKGLELKDSVSGNDLLFSYRLFQSRINSKDKNIAIEWMSHKIGDVFDGYNPEEDINDLFFAISGFDEQSTIYKYINEGGNEVEDLLSKFKFKDLKEINNLGEIINVSDLEGTLSYIKQIELHLSGKDAVELAHSIIEQSIAKSDKTDLEKERILDYYLFAMFGKQMTLKEMALTESEMEVKLKEFLGTTSWDNKPLVEKYLVRTYRSSYNELIKRYDNNEVNNKSRISALISIFGQKFDNNMDDSGMTPQDETKLAKLMSPSNFKENSEVIESLLFSGFKKDDMAKRWDYIDEMYAKGQDIENSPWSSLGTKQKYAVLRAMSLMDVSKMTPEDISQTSIAVIMKIKSLDPNLDIDVEEVINSLEATSRNDEIIAMSQNMKQRFGIPAVFSEQKYAMTEEDWETYANSYDPFDDFKIDNNQTESIAESPEVDSGDDLDFVYDENGEKTDDISISSIEEDGMLVTTLTIPNKFTSSEDDETIEVKADNYLDSNRQIVEKYMEEAMGIDVDMVGNIDEFAKTTGIKLSDSHILGPEDLNNFSNFLQAYVIQNIDRTVLEMNNIDYERFLDDLIDEPGTAMQMLGRLVEKGENPLSDTIEFKDGGYRLNFATIGPINPLDAKYIIRDARQKVVA